MTADACCRHPSEKDGWFATQRWSNKYLKEVAGSADVQVLYCPQRAVGCAPRVRKLIFTHYTATDTIHYLAVHHRGVTLAAA